MPATSFFILTMLALTPVSVSAETVSEIPITIPQVAGSMLLLVAVIGVLYSLWRTTRAYGGIIGQGLRRFGIGIMFLSVEALDRIAQNFASSDLLLSFVPKYYLSNAHDALLLLGLCFLALGFSKLSTAAKG